MDKASAEKLSTLMLQITSQVNDSVSFVKDKDIENIFEYEEFRHSAGKILGEIYLEIEEKIWKKYPELRPDEMGGTYKINKSIYEPRFYTRDDD